MASKHHTDDVYRPKRIPKNPIKFKLQLNEEQKEAKKRKIPICNVPTYGENTVAQHAMALLLALSKKIFRSTKRVKEGNYDYHGLRGFDLKGKTVGIIGTGHIGYYMIKMLSGFDVNVIAYDPFPNKDLAKELGFTYVSLNKLITDSDIISLHVPLLPDTHHMLGMKEVRKMKKGVIIINSARGGLVDPKALLWGLESGTIGGAGMDVLEEEAIIKDHIGQIELPDIQLNENQEILTNQLMVSLNKEKIEGEKNIDFETRIIKDAIEIFNLGDIFNAN